MNWRATLKTSLLIKPYKNPQNPHLLHHFLSLSLRVLQKTMATLTRCLARSLPAFSSLISRSTPSLSLSTASCSTFSLLRLRPLSAAAVSVLRHLPQSTSARSFSTRQTSSSLNDPNPNWSNRPPKETILLDGCDFEHWLVVMEKPEGDPTRDEIIDSYIKTLAMIVGR